MPIVSGEIAPRRYEATRRYIGDKVAPGARLQQETPKREADLPGIVKGLFIALALGVCASANPQTRPAVTSLGPDYPKTEMFIGNSFFYYNNGMPSEVSQLEKAADPEHKNDYRTTMVTIGGSASNGTTSRAISAPMRSAAMNSTTTTSSCSRRAARSTTPRS
jgi:hypothetical protein